jgi:hypothetical protein
VLGPNNIQASDVLTVGGKPVLKAQTHNVITFPISPINGLLNYTHRGFTAAKIGSATKVAAYGVLTDLDPAGVAKGDLTQTQYGLTQDDALPKDALHLNVPNWVPMSFTSNGTTPPDSNAYGYLFASINNNAPPSQCGWSTLNAPVISAGSATTFVVPEFSTVQQRPCDKYNPRDLLSCFQTTSKDLPYSVDDVNFADLSPLSWYFNPPHNSTGYLGNVIIEFDSRHDGRGSFDLSDYFDR